MRTNFCRRLWTSALLAISLVLGQSALAETKVPQAVEAKVRAALQEALPSQTVEAVFAVPMPGVVGIELEGNNLLYASEDGRFILTGELYEMTAPIRNLGEARRSVKRKEVMDAVPVEDMLVFSPKGEVKTHVSVFTDVDCGYCRKLHLEMAELNALGIEVRYLAYPRAGVGSPTYNKIVSAWCAGNPNEALTSLKAGKTIPTATCDNPVASQFDIGNQIGVRGTPAIVTASGELLPGYMPAADLAAAVGLE